MSEYRVCRLLPYAQHLVRLAVCDVLEQEGCLDFVREGAGGAVLAHVTVYGNPGRFSMEQLMENELQLEPLEPAERGTA